MVKERERSVTVTTFTKHLDLSFFFNFHNNTFSSVSLINAYLSFFLTLIYEYMIIREKHVKKINVVTFPSSTRCLKKF